MGKIFDNITSQIMSARKAKDPVKEGYYKNVKKALSDFATSKDGAPVVNANNGSIPDEKEIEILDSYVKGLKKSIKEYMMIQYQGEVDFISNNFLPKEADEEDIANYVRQYISENGNFDAKSMGRVISYVRNNVANANGGTVAKIVKSYIS